MNFNEVSGYAQKLGYRDKSRLAKPSIQLARMEEEEENLDRRVAVRTVAPIDPELLQYVIERLRELKPAKRDTVHKPIGAMFQLLGGISDPAKERLFTMLLRKRLLSMDNNSLDQYPDRDA
jgi:hypothetical protein